MEKTTRIRLSAAAMLAWTLALAPALLALSGCETDSSNTSSVVSDKAGTVYDFSGLYHGSSTNADGSSYLVFPHERQSGTKLTWMRIVQNGSSLQGYDNAGKNWHGSVSTVADATARFSLEGATTAGAAVTIAGTMAYASSQSTISASWLEAGGFSGSFFATATVSAPSTNTPSAGLQISPSSATIATNGSRTFTASGGNGTYTWAHSGSCGTLSADTGSTVVYRHDSAGTDTLTVTSDGKSATATIVCE